VSCVHPTMILDLMHLISQYLSKTIHTFILGRTGLCLLVNRIEVFLVGNQVCKKTYEHQWKYIYSTSLFIPFIF